MDLLSAVGGREPLIPFEAALAALGDDGSMGHRHAEVPVLQIVGSVSRSDDFDADFRPRGRHLTERLRQVRRLQESGAQLPPVELVQLGEMYFVVDGHHRIALARRSSRPEILARVRRICTVAFAMACLRVQHLGSKAAESAFLERVPLAWDVRRDLWLDDPQTWWRLADAAEAWGYDRALETGRVMDRETLAASWWSEVVTPVVHGAATEPDLGVRRDIEIYAAAVGAAAY